MFDFGIKTVRYSSYYKAWFIRFKDGKQIWIDQWDLRWTKPPKVVPREH